MEKRVILYLLLVFSLILVTGVYAQDNSTVALTSLTTNISVASVNSSSNISLNGSPDVAYIYNNKMMIDKNVINVFSNLSLKTDLININNISNINLSKYKFIFIGDEYFNKMINLNDYNLILANHYLGEQAGITDKMGVSTLASIDTLKVTFNKSNLAVYSAAKDSSGMSLSYYFLGKDHKANVTQTYAGTYSVSSGNAGDVVSFVQKGSILENSKTAFGNICFFGISMSDYWTNDSKNLLKDCVLFVNVPAPIINNTNSTNISVTCNNSIMCDDKNINTTDVCVNSGKNNSYCSNNLVPEVFINSLNATADITSVNLVYSILFS